MALSSSVVFSTNTSSSKNQLSISNLLKYAAMHGTCEKENVSFLSYWFPWLFPRWKKRFLVICGNYLFRFVDEDSDDLKGTSL